MAHQCVSRKTRLQKRKQPEAEQPASGSAHGVSEDSDSEEKEPTTGAVVPYVPPSGSQISADVLAKMFAAVHMEQSAALM